MAKPKLKFLLRESLLKTVKNSIGTKMFRNSFYIINSKRMDILKNGQLSCAIYASSVLYVFKLTKDIHATVQGTIRDLEAGNWQKVGSPKPGDVLVWASKKSRDGLEHQHIGFYIGSNNAVSNAYRKGTVAKHHWTYGVKNGKPVRKITAIYRFKDKP